MWFIDFFTVWYARFLKKWMPYFKIRVLLGQLVWTILAIIFWNTLYTQDFSELVSPSYFFFVMFIYSVRGLIESLVRSHGDSSIYL